MDSKQEELPEQENEVVEDEYTSDNETENSNVEKEDNSTNTSNTSTTSTTSDDMIPFYTIVGIVAIGVGMYLYFC